MNITCPSCSSRYTVDDARIPESGVTIRCPSCGHKFIARRPAAAGSVPLPGRRADPLAPPPSAEPDAPTSGSTDLGSLDLDLETGDYPLTEEEAATSGGGVGAHAPPPLGGSSADLDLGIETVPSPSEVPAPPAASPLDLGADAPPLELARPPNLSPTGSAALSETFSDPSSFASGLNDPATYADGGLPSGQTDPGEPQSERRPPPEGPNLSLSVVLKTYRTAIAAFGVVATLVLIGAFTHFMTPIGAFGYRWLSGANAPAPVAPPPPPPPPPTLANIDEIQSLIDEHSFESFRSAILTLEKAGTGLATNALALAKTRVLATLAFGEEAFALTAAQQATRRAPSKVDPDEDSTGSGVLDVVKVQAGLNVLEGEAERAVETLTEALAEHPKDAESAYLLARAHEASGRTAEALEGYDRALVANPEHAPAARGMGRVLENMNQGAAAAEWFEKAYHWAPTDARSAQDAARLWQAAEQPGRVFRATIAAAKGALRGLAPEGRAEALLAAVQAVDAREHLLEARAIAAEAARLAPGNSRAVALTAVATALGGDYEGGLKLVQPLLRRDPEDVPALIAQGRIHLAADQLAEALAALEAAVPLDTSGEARLWLARILRRLDRTPEARTALEGTDALRARIERSQIALDDGALEDATRWAQTAIEGAPNSAIAHAHMARVEVKKGALEAAQVAYERALELDPGRTVARVGLAEVLRRRAQKNPRPRRSPELGRAAALLLSTLQNHPGEAQAVYGYGRILEVDGDFEGALVLYETAVTLNASDPSAHLELVSAYLRTRPARLKAAADALKKADDLAQGVPRADIAFWKARLALAQDDARTAVASMKRAVELDRQSALYLYWLGQALEENNSLFEAISAYEESLKKDRSFWAAHRALGQAAIERHRYPEAREYFEQYRRLVPDDSSVWTDIGTTFSGENRDREALAAFDKVLKEDATALRPLIESGKIYSRQGKGRRAQALFRRATAAHASAGEAWCLLGLSLAQGRLNRAARTALTKCKALQGPPDLVQSAQETLEEPTP